MELRHLENFVAVAEERSFTRAASREHLVQSALSVSIQSLEKELAARLFERSTHQVALTDAGQALLPEARRTLEAAAAARAIFETAVALGGTRSGEHGIGLVKKQFMELDVGPDALRPADQGVGGTDAGEKPGVGDRPDRSSKPGAHGKHRGEWVRQFGADGAGERQVG